MFQGILKKVIGTKYERELKRLMPYVEAINPVISTGGTAEASGYFGRAGHPGL